MTPGIEPLVAYRNGTFDEEWTFTDDDLAEPVDFTGWSGALHVRLYGAADSTVIALANVTSDIEGVWIREPSEGIVRVLIDRDTLTAAYDAMIGENEAGSSIAFVYDLRLTTPTGAEEIWMEGSFTIKPGVTSA